MCPGGGQGEEVQALQGVNQLSVAQCDQGAQHFVTSIVKQNEQLASFIQLLEVVARSTGQLEGFAGGPSPAQEGC